jgi:cell division protein FtsI (penicillin-binding protein 3)
MIRRDHRIRVFIVFVVFVGLFSIVIIRLFLLQVSQKRYFSQLAQQQHNITVIVNPERAPIYDRTKKTLIAFNRDEISAFILPHQFLQEEKLKNFLKTKYSEVYKRIDEFPERQFLWLDRRLTPEQQKDLNNYNLEDIQFVNESHRFYPYKTMAHVLGFTNIDNIGISGLELEFNNKLMGKKSLLKLQKDARVRTLYFDKKVELSGHKGTQIVLTLDSKLQFLAAQELEKTVELNHAKGGSVVIINPDNGEILAMVVYPFFDPNQKSITNLEITKNTIITECFELGSVMKTFCALAALDEGVVKYDELIDCEGKVAYVNGFRVENWKTTNIVPFYEAVKKSSNIAMAKISVRLGEKLYMHLRKIGFGEKTQINFPGERSGFVNPPKKWSRSSPLVMSFGYEIMASLIQLTRAFCAIANGGYLITPKLILYPQKSPDKTKKIKLYSDNTLDSLKNILEKIGEHYGIPGYRVMGKTGTARCVKEGKYSKKSHVYTFAGIIENGKYKRVIVTFIKEPEKAGLWASEIAAPLFQKIGERMVMYETRHTTNSKNL